MKKIRVMPESLGEAVVITPFVGFGDLLYHTPVFRILAKLYKGVDVWCFNPEPLFNNPDINKVFKIGDDDFATLPTDFYFDFIFHASGKHNFFIESLYTSTVHTTEYYSLAFLHSSLPNEEKHLTLNWSPEDEVSVRKKTNNVFTQNKFVAIVNPAIGWPSRTLPYEYYRRLIEAIAGDGDIVVLVGKEINPQSFLPNIASSEKNSGLLKTEKKSMYCVDEFLANKNVIDLTNKLSLAECAALYSLADIAVNTENGNMVISGTNDRCWNLYIPTLTAPQYRIPYRRGSQSYRTTVVHNDLKYYPGSDFRQIRGGYDYIATKVELPSVETIIEAYRNCRETILREVVL